MVLDTIDNADFYKSLSKNIEIALNFLQRTDLNNLEEGRHEIDGDNVFALILNYATDKEHEDKWEVHKKYFDIQFIAKGMENIAIANILDMTPIIDYVKDNDYQLFRGKGTKLLLKENDFIILGPKEVHQPGIYVRQETGEVKKIVVKVLI